MTVLIGGFNAWNSLPASLEYAAALGRSALAETAYPIFCCTLGLHAPSWYLSVPARAQKKRAHSFFFLYSPTSWPFLTLKNYLSICFYQTRAPYSTRSKLKEKIPAKQTRLYTTHSIPLIFKMGTASACVHSLISPTLFICVKADYILWK